MTVNFWSFTKKSNSTARPTGTPAQSLDCKLKDQSGVLRPVLEVAGIINPSSLNYAQISAYGRFYYVTDWTYYRGIWEASLQVDAMASYKTAIGNESKYVLRSSYASTPSAIDTLYPALAWAPNYYYDTASFNWTRDFTSGVCVLGVANRSAGHRIGAIKYYAMAPATIGRLVEFMMPGLSDWLDSFTGFTDVLYRSIYGPFDYIKSCKWFPVSYTSSLDQEIVVFGNYQAYDPNDQNNTVYARPLDTDITEWYVDSRTLLLPAGWLSLEGKYRAAPYAHLYLVINPWGVIELNPEDFTDSRTLKVYVYADFISGDGILKVYKVLGSSEYFITQKNARMSVDVNLSQTSVDARGLLSGVGTAAGGIVAAAASGGAAAVVGGAVTAAGGVSSAAISATPTLSGSLGTSFDSAVAMEGAATLIYQSTYFAQESNAEFGKPLLDVRQLSSIPGYIKCADGHLDVAAYPEETAEIENYLTGGFFYE